MAQTAKPRSRNPELSWFKGHPILDHSDLLAHGNPKCKPLTAEWKKNIKSKPWAKGYSGAVAKELKDTLKLRDRLLSFAGEEACMPEYEEDFALLMRHGEIWLPKGLKFMRGAISRRHENAALLWEANNGRLALATGYYLGDDGMWRQHSWCILSNTRGGRVVETTNRGVFSSVRIS